MVLGVGNSSEDGGGSQQKEAYPWSYETDEKSTSGDRVGIETKPSTADQAEYDGCGGSSIDGCQEGRLRSGDR